jgi:hypothetical protein
MKRIFYLAIIVLGVALSFQSCCPNSCAAEPSNTELNSAVDQLSPAILESETGLPAATTSIVQLESNRDLTVYEVKHNGYTYIVVRCGAGLAIAKE